MTATAPSPDRAVPGTPPTTQEAIAPVGYFPHAWYLAVLKEQVFARWSPPSEYFQSSRPPAALVSFRIDRAGGIGGVTLKESSGSARFDKSALAAVQGLGRVPALPEQYREENLDVVIRFQNQK
jgi:TonB family protein